MPKKAAAAALTKSFEFMPGYFESKDGITNKSVAISLTTLLHNTFFDFYRVLQI